MKEKKNNVNKITIISVIIVLLVLCLSIGWSSFNASLQLDSVAMVRIKSDIRVTGFNQTSSSNGGTSANNDYNVSSVNGTVTLPNSNSTVTYRVEITNMEIPANTYMGINQLTSLPNNLQVVSITDYTLKDKICDDNDPTDCSSGAQKTFYITIGYKENAYDANNTSFGFNIDIDFKKVFDITYSGFTNPPLSPKTAMDGDTPTITFNNNAPGELNVTSGGVNLVKGVNYTYVNHVLQFITPITDHVFIGSPSAYTITYVLNGGTQVSGQITSYAEGVVENILPLESSIDATFGGWYLNGNFLGDQVVDTSTLSGNVTLYAKWTYKVAKIGNTYYATLKQAINAAPNNTNTLIDLIHDTSENITIANTKVITLDLHNSVLSNTGNNPIITNNGTLTLTNGLISSDATQGAINNNATFNMTGGRIEITGTRQAIYNTGTVNISGDSYLSNVSIERATVQNLSGGIINIACGTIVASNYSAVVNEGTLQMGTKDGNVSTTSPVIRGAINGVDSTVNFTFYDGKVSGKQAAFNDESYISDVETGYELVHTLEYVDNDNYRLSYLAQSIYTVIFNPTGGTINQQDASREVAAGSTVGALPMASKSGFVLEGWYDDDNDQHKISASEVINGNITFYAHWDEVAVSKVARVGLVEYNTFAEAWAAVPNNSQTTITLLENISVSETVNVESTKNVIIDLNGNTMDISSGANIGTIFEVYGSLGITDSASGGKLIGGKIISNTHNPVIVNKSRGIVNISGGTISSNVSQVIDNSGTMTISGGTITMGNVTNGVLNNNAGATLNMTGGTISATIAGSKRQAIYNKGTVNISGTATLISASSDRATVQNDANNAKIIISGGTIQSTNASCQRGAIQNVANAYLTITGGTIVSKSTHANGAGIQNAGTLVIGEEGGNISISSPDIQGERYGVNHTGGTFKFYDGVIKGLSSSINGTVTEIEPSATQIDTTVQISGATYKVTYLSQN